MTLFAEIRAAARAVAERAQCVRIDQERLEALARELAPAPAPSEVVELDPARRYRGTPEATPL